MFWPFFDVFSWGGLCVVAPHLKDELGLDSAHHPSEKLPRASSRNCSALQCLSKHRRQSYVISNIIPRPLTLRLRILYSLLAVYDHIP